MEPSGGLAEGFDQCPGGVGPFGVGGAVHGGGWGGAVLVVFLGVGEGGFEGSDGPPVAGDGCLQGLVFAFGAAGGGEVGVLFGLQVGDGGLEFDLADVAVVAGGDGLDHGGVLGEAVGAEVLHAAGGAVGAFESFDEERLALQHLPHIGVEGSLGDVAEDPHRGVLVVLADNSAFALFQVRGAPRHVDVMQRHGPGLDIGSSSHLLGRAEQYRDFPGAAVGEQVGLRCGVAVVVDEADTVGFHATRDEFVFDGLVDRPLGAIGLGCGTVAEHDLQAAGHR